ncbi:hypothetical protein [Prescottella agglutinans]|uniref:WD40 repeat domain-containing protein n=1 Tax=Prescottella agglutinans TaxID=1644129 RepID=A0ABT6M6A1_9NOCA|nr:hypothetical protein [Prescottella agglutinans]MDH6279837.1 hypothetical protein [Prescottella agglutinans]
MSNAFLTPVGAELTMPERSTVAAHPAGWLVSSPDRLEVFDATFGRSLFTTEFEACGTSAVSDRLDYAAVSLGDRAQLRRPDGSVVWEHVHGGWPKWGTGSAYWDANSETFAFTVPGDDSDRWCLVRDGEMVACIELTDLTAGGSHVSRVRSGHLGLSIGAGQDGCAVYWVDPTRLGEHPAHLVYDEEMVVDAGRGDAIVTLTHETDILRLRSAVDAESVTSVCSADIDASLEEGEPFHWVVDTQDRLVVCVGGDESRIFVSGTADLGSWTQLDLPAGLNSGEFLVGGNDGLCASYDWPTGAVRLWHGPLA